jgi:hypothetical protein
LQLLKNFEGESAVKKYLSSSLFSLSSGAGVLLALLTLNLGADAQSLQGASTPGTPSVTVLHFSDGEDDHPGRMTADTRGNVYIAAALGVQGRSGFAVLKYNSQNKLQVIRRTKVAGEFGGEAQAVQVDAQGNIYAGGSNTFGGLVMSFTPAGSKRWEQHFNGEPLALAIDAAGNLYAAGTGGSGPFQEWVIVKYSNAGNVLWEIQHTGTAAGDSRVVDLQLDLAGNPVVLGWTNTNLQTLTRSITTLKLDPHGNTLWTQDFTAIPRFDQVPQGLALDRSGNVYITGTTIPAEGPLTPFTVKYDTHGNRKFVLMGNGAGGSSVAVDPSGDIVLTGANFVLGHSPFISASKIRANGTRVWTTSIQATGKILADAGGNVFVAGSLQNTNTQFPEQSDYFVTKLSSNGALLSATLFRQGNDVRDATFDSLGNLLVTGDFVNPTFNHDIVTLKLP